MKPQFLHKNRSNEPTVNFLPEQASEGDDTNTLTHFFYVGKNPVRIEFLIRSFDYGYVAHHPESAISILKRMSTKPEIPDIVIIDAAYREPQLWQLHRFMATHPLFAAVPFVLDVSGLPASDIKRSRN